MEVPLKLKQPQQLLPCTKYFDILRSFLTGVTFVIYSALAVSGFTSENANLRGLNTEKVMKKA